MATERFYRLSEKKKKIICEAAKKEFARVPFDKASINQIVLSAHISRGSFYTYFNDKHDALEYLMEDHDQKICQVGSQILEINGGDYLDMLQKLFHYYTDEVQDTREMMDVMRNFFCQPNLTWIPLFLDDLSRPAADSKESISLQWIYDKVDRSKLRLETQEEFYSMLMLGANALINAIRQFYTHPDQREMIEGLLEVRLTILRKGTSRQENAGI